MGEHAFIGADALEHAVRAHRDRTELHGPRPIHRIIASLQVDAEKFQAMAQVVADYRAPEDRGIYAGGLVDGFVLGVRAARFATPQPTDSGEGR